MSEIEITDPHARDIATNQMVQTQEMHCSACGRFLGLQAVILGIVKIKCPNCKEWTTIEILPESLHRKLDNVKPKL